VPESLGSGNVIPIEANKQRTTSKQQQQVVHANAARVAVMYMQLKRHGYSMMQGLGEFGAPELSGELSSRWRKVARCATNGCYCGTACTSSMGTSR
jgi:hypothetical protein